MSSVDASFVGPPNRRPSRPHSLATALLGRANLTWLVLGCIEAKFLQENMRLKTLAEIYTMHSFAQLCNLKIV